MKEYQAVMLRLSNHMRDDEDALTDLLNERSRAGWDLALITQGPTGGAAGSSASRAGDRLTVVFERGDETAGRKSEARKEKKG